MKKINLLLTLIISVSLLYSCASNPETGNPELNSDASGEIIMSSKISYDDFFTDDIGQLIYFADLIVRCVITDVGDPFLRYGITHEELYAGHTDVFSDEYHPINFIATPYKYEVLEVLYGEAKAAQTLTTNMPYGNINGYLLENDSFPVLNLGGEYILFLNKRTDPLTMQFDGTYILCTPNQSWIPLSYDVVSEKSAYELNVRYSTIGNDKSKLQYKVYKLLFGDCDTIADVTGKVKGAVKNFNPQKYSADSN